MWNYSGTFITTAVARIFVAKVVNGVVGTELKAVPSGSANISHICQHDSRKNQYIFNMSTKNLSVGI